MKRSIQAVKCLTDTGCKPVTLRYRLEEYDLVAFFDGEPELAPGQLLASPLIEYIDEVGRLVLQAVEWLKVIDVETLAHQRRVNVLRGANYSTAIAWPSGTTFHAIPVPVAA